MMKTNKLTEEITEKWIKAVVNIEGRPTVTDLPEFGEMYQRLKEKKVTFQEYNEWVHKFLLNTPRYTGTAIYFTYHNKPYLVTARHVVEETIRKNYAAGDPDSSDRVFSKIFLIQDGTHQVSSDEGPVMIFLLSAGPAAYRPFIFSSKEDDIAILSLEPKNTGGQFLKVLNERGYKPITIDDVDTICQLNKMQPMLSVGFPADLFQVGQKQLTQVTSMWESDILSLPVVSAGTVDDPLPGKNFFTGNIFVYHGNSGGPIVSNNKLIGIVSHGFPELKKFTNQNGAYYRARNIAFIKSSLILPLVQALEARLKRIPF